MTVLGGYDLTKEALNSFQNSYSKNDDMAGRDLSQEKYLP